MKKNETLIIAEAGINHNGHIHLAKKMIHEAKIAGANIVKFQTFITDKLITPKAKKTNYQKTYQSKKSLHSMLKNYELSFKDFKLLSNICKKKKIEFLSTGFDIQSVHFLHKLKQKRFKIPSGEITNFPLLKFISRIKKEIILSTGMSSLKEIESALNVISRFGTPLSKITVLHCNSAYPTLSEDANLRAMETIKKKFSVNVGYSDHTIGIEAPIAAVSLGAKIIEKHFTLSKTLKGPDHNSSIEIGDLKKMILSIRKVEKLLGSNKKFVTKSEKENISYVRKSIVASRFIKKGELFSESNLTTKRPGYGLSPMKWEKVIGKRAKKNFKKNELL
jgi:N,N'-diacetyllegionaminate synthase